MSNENKLTQVEMEMMIDEVMKVMPIKIKMLGLKAKMLRSYYNSLIEEGFSAEEALKIVSEEDVYGN